MFKERVGQGPSNRLQLEKIEAGSAGETESAICTNRPRRGLAVRIADVVCRLAQPRKRSYLSLDVSTERAFSENSPRSSSDAEQTLQLAAERWTLIILAAMALLAAAVVWRMRATPRWRDSLGAGASAPVSPPPAANQGS